MRYFLLFILFLIASCNKQPFPAPATPQTTWLDEQRNMDTIITNINNRPNMVYYSAFQWQQLADTSLSHGYRLIAIRKGDSIWVQPINDPSSNYNGPFLLHINNSHDTLNAQNFLDTSAGNLTRSYVLMK